MTRFGLPKESLLRKPREFAQVYRNGRRLKGAGFSLVYLTNGLSENRLGISVHRMLRGVVRRNRIKRIVREVFRRHRDLFPPSSDIVFTVGPYFKLNSTGSVRKAVAGLAVQKQVELT